MSTNPLRRTTLLNRRREIVFGRASLASAETTTSGGSPDTAVTEVRQDADGSDDVPGTASGTDVFYDVSADLATVTLNSVHGGGADTA